MIDKILWSKLKPYIVDKRRSFEELCYQIAKKLYGINGLYGYMGEFISIDDTGGGDGVEFYINMPNGDQWGWQAKFFYPNDRLSDGGRKEQVKVSLEVACEKHPNLKRWFLCTPTNFTQDKTNGKQKIVGEQTWFEQTLPNRVPDGMNVELVHWGESEFLDWLGKPEFGGMQHYFFGQLELTLEWFHLQVDKQIRSLGDKYEGNLHTDTRIDSKIHHLLADSAFVETIAECIIRLQEQLEEYDNSVERLRKCSPYGVEWASYHTPLLSAADSMRLANLQAIAEVKKACELLKLHQWQEVMRLDSAHLLHKIQEKRQAYDQIQRELLGADLVYSGQEEHKEKNIGKVRQVSFGPQEHSSTLFGSLRDIFKQLDAVDESELHILGQAGIGKSHVAAHICRQRLDADLPALLLRGVQFTSDDPLTLQLRNILDIPPTYSWDDFLQALSMAADVYRIRIPIVIDGLNEATHNGAFSPVWKAFLPGLASEIAKFQNLVLITTCRDTYVSAVWDGTKPKRLEHMYGFGSEDVEVAIHKYFDVYKIKANLTAAPIEQFRHPIYLRIFCESQNRERRVEKQIYIGEQTLFEVFEHYLDQTNQAICNRFTLHRSIQIVRPALSGIAEYLWKERSRSILLTRLAQIADGKSLNNLIPYSHSKTKALEDEGLILCRDWGEDSSEDIVYFTYDLLGGYLIAKYLIAENKNDLESFLRSDTTINLLFSEDYATLHPLCADIRRALAALLPVLTEFYLHDFTDNPIAVSVSLKALFEIPPSAVDNMCVGFITRLFGFAENRKYLLELSTSTIGHVGHPLNAYFWIGLLRRLSMPERDESWTEHVRENTDYFLKLVEQVELSFQDHEAFDANAEPRLSLLAEYLMWVLTSTGRALRDKTTRALYWYGRRWPNEFLNMVLDSLTINDPYISERMLAAAYGVAMARHCDFRDHSFVDTVLPTYGRQLYEMIFKLDAPHSTTHILSRDYARHIVELAILHHPKLLSIREKRRITPPFKDGGIRKWGKNKDRNKDQYHAGNHPLFTFGDDDPFGWMGPKISKYHPKTPEYKRAEANLWWRLYDLGYTLERFGEIDKSIAWFNQGGYSRYQQSVNTYGEKYRLIAAYELAGYRHDLGLLKHDYDTEYEYLYERFSYADIDPSFPEEPNSLQIINVDFLNDRTLPVEEWILRSEDPDLKSHLVKNGIYNEEGPWVLLDGDLNQTRAEVNRTIFINVRAVLVAVENVEHIVKLLTSEFGERDYHHNPPSDHYTFAGEIPWADTYSENREYELSIRTNTRIVSDTKEGIVLYREGVRLVEPELEDIWPKLLELPSEKTNDAQRAQLFFVALAEHGLTVDVETVAVEHQEYDHETFRALSPVRSNNWEGYHSPIIASRDVATPARQIAAHLNLCGQPQTFDLFDQSGKWASVSVRSEEDYLNIEKLTYLRRDLLDRYLVDTRHALVWIIFGAREYFSEDHQYKEFPEGFVHRKIFNQAIAYVPR